MLNAMMHKNKSYYPTLIMLMYFCICVFRVSRKYLGMFLTAKNQFNKTFCLFISKVENRLLNVNLYLKLSSTSPSPKYQIQVPNPSNKSKV